MHTRCNAITMLILLTSFSQSAILSNRPSDRITLIASLASANDSETLRPPAPSSRVIEAERRRIDAIAKASKSTVGVFGLDGQGGGSGMVISADGYVLTNYHVSDGFGTSMRIGLSNGEMHEAIIVGIDPTGDLALLKMFGRDDFPAATIVDSNSVRVGDWCFASGNPFVLATNLQPTTTWGIVSGVHRYQYPSGTILEYTDCIQTDAAINPGNSGGPLYNANGDLIGVNGRGSFEKRGRVNVGVGYAISINQAMLFLGHLKSGRIVDHATLGFTVASRDDRKVTISNILESSDAYRRGLRYGDQIISLDHHEVTSVNQLKNLLGIYPSEVRLAITFRNEDGKVVDTYIRLNSLHLPDELVEIMSGKPLEGGPPPDREKNQKKRPRKKPSDNEPKDGEPNPDHRDRPSDQGKQQEDNDQRKNDPQKKPADGESTAESVVEAFKERLNEHFETRTGFANYYFNRQELLRVSKIDRIIEKKDWRWTFAGESPSENTSFTTVLSPTQLNFQFGGQNEILEPVRGWTKLIESQSFSGVAIALSLWKQWHTIGPAAMGESTYIGTTPIIGRKQWCDLVKITSGEVDAYIYVDPATKEIALIEIQADRNMDRLEVYFDDYAVRKLSSREPPDNRSNAAPNTPFNFPNRIRYSYGPSTPIVIDIHDIAIDDSRNTAPLPVDPTQNKDAALQSNPDSKSSDAETSNTATSDAKTEVEVK